MSFYRHPLRLGLPPLVCGPAHHWIVPPIVAHPSLIYFPAALARSVPAEGPPSRAMLTPNCTCSVRCDAIRGCNSSSSLASLLLHQVWYRGQWTVEHHCEGTIRHFSFLFFRRTQRLSNPAPVTRPTGQFAVYVLMRLQTIRLI